MKRIGFLFVLISNFGWTQSDLVIACPPYLPRPVDVAYRISMQPEKIERTELDFINSDSLKNIRSKNTNRLVIGLPNVVVIYPAFFNSVQIGFTDDTIEEYFLECDQCDSIYKNPNKTSEWVIMVSQTGKFTLRAINSEGLLGEAEVLAVPLPKPSVYLDNFNADSIVSIIPKKILLKYDASIPLSVRFLVKSWEVKINNRTFVGSSSELSQDVRNFLESEEQGTLIFSIKYYSPIGLSDLKEIIEFNLN